MKWIDENLLKFLPTLVSIMTLVLVGVTLGMVLTLRDHLSSPFFYGEVVYDTVHGEYCPGDVLEYTVERTVTRPPAAVIRVEGWWSQTRREIVLSAELPGWFPWAYPVEAEIAEHAVVIPNLPPGEYEYIVMGVVVGTRPNYYAVPLTMLDC